MLIDKAATAFWDHCVRHRSSELMATVQTAMLGALPYTVAEMRCSLTRCREGLRSLGNLRTVAQRSTRKEDLRETHC